MTAQILNLELGALSPTIAEQLEAQGLALRSGQSAELFQKDATAISRCVIRGFMPDSVATRARKSLAKNIAAQCIAKATGEKA